MEAENQTTRRDAAFPVQPDVESFYHLNNVELSRAKCQGLACFVARNTTEDGEEKVNDQSPRVYCLGKCYAAPASGADTAPPIVEVHSRRPVVLERIVDGGALKLEAYSARGGLQGLHKAMGMPPSRVIQEIEVSRLRGRGGAGFGTGKKWRSVAAGDSAVRYVVANLDEGDPGAYVDRFIAELDSFCLLEGMAIAAHAVGASKGSIYVRYEYPHAIAALRRAIAAAQSSHSSPEGLHPKTSGGFLGTGLRFEVELIVGKGSYLCGEETAMLRAIENERPVACTRPPYVSERGLHGHPTVVNNAETLANIPWIIRHGGDEYAKMGFSSSRGTKVVSLNSLFRRPGLYEVEFGVPLRQLVEVCGGGLAKGGQIKGLVIGGPLAGVVPPTLLDTPFGFEELRAIGGSVGHGGFVAFDERTSIAQLMHHVFSFGAYESCGKCTPCRLGCPAVEQMFWSAARSPAASAVDERQYRDIIAALELASLCGFGTGLAEFAQSIDRHYGQELRACFR